MKVGIIGAGYVGLYAAQHFSSNPDFDITVLEQQFQVGGLWCYTKEIGNMKNGLPIHASMYDNLRTHIPKQLMALPDFPFETGKHLPTYIHHTSMLKYLQDYAQNFDLLKYIKFGVVVKSIKRLERADKVGADTQWQVTCLKFNPDSVASDGETQVYVFDKLLVCTGNHALVAKPEVPGIDGFPGEVLHSHDYRNNSRFRGKTVLVAGAGLSGVDITHEISEVATKVILANPRRLQMVNAKNPKSVVEEAGSVSRVEGSFVHLSNGTSYHVDVIVFCTGYQVNSDMFDANCEITYHNRRLMPFYKFLVHAKYPSLAVVSFLTKAIPSNAAMVQVQFLKKLLEGRFQLPSEAEMIADADAEYQRRLDMGFDPHYAHMMVGNLQFRYMEDLGAIADLKPFPPIKEKLLLYALEVAIQDPDHYRDTGVEILNDSDYELYPETPEIRERRGKLIL